MNFKIPLTETQRYALRTTCGFDGLPDPFRQEDFMRPGTLQEVIPESEMPAWKKELQKREQALNIEQEQLKHEINAFYTTHETLYNSCSKGKNRGEAAIAFRDALPRDDFLEHQRLLGENVRIYEEHEKITHKENTIYRRHSSKLLGIIGIAISLYDTPDSSGIEFYTQRIIPPENISVAREAVVSSVFSKEIMPYDMYLLRHIEAVAIPPLKTPRKNKHQSTFSTVQLAFSLNHTNIDRIQESLHRLTGLLCHLYVPRDYEMAYHEGTITEYHHRWFIPQARKALIKELCA